MGTQEMRVGVFRVIMQKIMLQDPQRINKTVWGILKKTCEGRVEALAMLLHPRTQCPVWRGLLYPPSKIGALPPYLDVLLKVYLCGFAAQTITKLLIMPLLTLRQYGRVLLLPGQLVELVFDLTE